MREWVRVLRMWCVGALLVSSVALAAGCGSSGAGGSGTSGHRLAGTVEAPADQVALAGSPVLATIARAMTAGSPAEAAGPVARRAVRNGQVVVVRLRDRQRLGEVMTDAAGRFVVEGMPEGTWCLVTVTATGRRGQMTLKGLVRTGSGTQTAVTVDETTTVGAEAGEVAVEEGADDDVAAELAAEVAGEQEQDEEEEGQEPPDLCDRDRIRERAHQHLMGNLEGKLPPLLGPGATERQSWRAIMASQAYARVVLGLPRPIHLSRAQVLALAAMPRLTVPQAQAALNAAGILTSDGAAVTEADVTLALTTLKARPRLQTVLAGVPDGEGKMPPVVALLLAEQVNDTTVPFHIATQAEMNAYVTALNGGTAVPGPGEPGAGGGHGNGHMGGRP